MRFVATVVTVLLLASPAAATGSLHAVYFIDAKEGWVAGDDGVIQHTLDGGKTWEHQASGTKASLRGLAFLDESTGWAVGRDEKPYGGGSVGVVLFTRDGGLRWQRLLDNSLPGLNAVRFTDPKTGFLLGDGQDPFASGIFRTTDGGKSWEPVLGTRSAAWAAGDFQDGKNGVLVGPWGKLATFRNQHWAFADPASFAGRGLRAVQILQGRLIAVGDGGLVLTSASSGERWAHAELGIPAEARICLDFHAIASVENCVWIAGRPGSVVLRSDDGGTTWAVKKVKPKLTKGGAGTASLRIRSLHFVDKNNGWAVGTGGFVLATSDGGDTWKEQQRGSVPDMLLMHAQAKGAAFDAVGYFRGLHNEIPAGVVSMTTEGPGGVHHAGTADRLHKAVRMAGGFGADEITALTLPQYLELSSKEDIVKAWDAAHGGNAPHELLRHLVLALRMWQPTVILMDDPNAPGAAGLMAEALKEAVKRAEDPNEFPEQLSTLGLMPIHFWSLFAAAEKGTASIDTSSLPGQLDGIPREIAAVAYGYVGERPKAFPMRRSYQFVRYGQAARQRRGDLAPIPSLTSGISNEYIMSNNRVRRVLEAAQREKIERDVRQIVNLVDRLPRSEIVLGQLLPLLKALPEDEAARAGFAVANAYVRMGEWDLARETFLLTVDRAPAHPLAAEAYRWLVQHNVSSEVRRRYELQQFAIVHPENSLQYSIAKTDVRSSFDVNTFANAKSSKGPREPAAKAEGVIQQTSAVESVANLFPPFAPTKEIRQWSRGAIEFNKRFEVFGSLATTDPRVQFSVQAARRNLGDARPAHDWYDRYAKHVVKGPWADAAASELWVDGMGPKPRRLAPCRLTDARPMLDGKLDDACWKAQPPMILTDASGASHSDYPTEAWLAYDAEFLYVAVRSKHPAGRSAATVKNRQRDANLDGYDRISLLLDLDRDYATYFRLEFDQRGCVREDCWGDASWNPKWYVAANAADDCWCVEVAIPLGELTSSPVTLDTRWACNLVRIVPGRGVQSVSQPADVEPRPEGMCILHFHQDARRAAPPMAEAP
jgi:photosystem II stability/assembly factor-like uncharacterized protein